jgi:PEP-CTERM motif
MIWNVFIVVCLLSAISVVPAIAGPPDGRPPVTKPPTKVSVPEPSTLLLIAAGAGVGLVAGLRRRRATTKRE